MKYANFNGAETIVNYIDRPSRQSLTAAMNFSA